ncbi:MAG: response regulator [Nitrospira sp.]|nr:response regulator [Nitrospira sp.]
MSARILVVDDAADSAPLVTKMMARRGFEVVSAPNGREGLHVLRTMSIAGILLDLEMPVMNGWTMLDELRWQGSTIPVIVMSHEGNQAKLRKFLEEGAQDYLVKPLNHYLLLQKSLHHFSLRTNVGEGLKLKTEGPRQDGPHQAEGVHVVQRGL